MKEKRFDYYRAKIRKAEQIIEFAAIADFLRYANANGIKQIIQSTDNETGHPCFMLSSKGALYICPSSGFETLEDYSASVQNGFAEAKIFYEAREKNCTTLAEYEMLTTAGITDAALFDEMKKAGYVDGFALFEGQRNEKKHLPKLESITNVLELFEYGKKVKLENFAHFQRVWEAGFTDPKAYDVAIEKGLNNAADFETFKAGKFVSVDDFKEAKRNGITTRDELLLYNDLNLAQYTDTLFDERLLLSILSKLKSGHRTDLKKLYEHFIKICGAYKRPDESGVLKFSPWFTHRLNNEKDVHDFLIGNNYVKRFGTFDTERNIFETMPIARRHVVIDGSNVAYNSSMSERGKHQPHIKNILTLVKKIKEEYHFEDVQVISDASLQHRVKDKELIAELKKICKYSESPPNEPADIHLINKVKRHHCLLITNDNFRDWKLRDQWIEDNIDYYSLRFVLNGDVVMLPFMERFGNQ